MTAIQWLLQELDKVNYHPTEAMIMYAKKLEKEQSKKDYKSGVIDGFNSRTLHMGVETDAEQYYNETYGSKGRYMPDPYYAEEYEIKGSDECYFEPMTNTSSATICKHCGKEKFMHHELQQINQDNPVTRGSTALVPTSCQTEISDDRTKLHWKTSLVIHTPEISDEEIEKAMWEHFSDEYADMWSERLAFRLACKWFREQLKKNL